MKAYDKIKLAYNHPEIRQPYLKVLCFDTMYKIGFLFDQKNNWIKMFFKKSTFVSNNKYKFIYLTDIKRAKNFDVLFILNYMKIIKEKILIQNKLNLVVHESNLPRGKGFAPVQWQVLNGKSLIPVKLIEATKEFDSGSIFGETSFRIKKTSLNDEIRKLQAEATIKIISEFLKKYPKIKSKKQIGKVTFFRRRKPEDSELDPNKSIIENFDLMRISNNKDYPSFFNYKKETFFLKIYKKNKKN